MKPLTSQECTDAIGRYSERLAQASEGNLSGSVEHCPGWSVADLVWHVREVQWFWATIAERALPEPPDDEARPKRPADEELIDELRAGSKRLVNVLTHVDPRTPCWTWSSHQAVGFVARHQVQEAAVHAWDAVNACGHVMALDPRISADGVDEFLTFSVADENAAHRGDHTPLEGTFVLRTSDTGDAWTVTDGHVPGSVQARRGAEDDVPVMEATSSELLLWLYRRLQLPSGQVDPALLARFHADTFTE